MQGGVRERMCGQRMGSQSVSGAEWLLAEVAQQGKVRRGSSGWADPGDPPSSPAQKTVAMTPLPQPLPSCLH